MADGVVMRLIPCTILFFFLGGSNVHLRTLLRDLPSVRMVNSRQGHADSIGAFCIRHIHSIGLDRLYIGNINGEWALRSILVKSTSVTEDSAID